MTGQNAHVPGGSQAAAWVERRKENLLVNGSDRATKRNSVVDHRCASLALKAKHSVLPIVSGYLGIVEQRQPFAGSPKP